MIPTNLKSHLLWPLPFLFFIAGYYGINFFARTQETVTTPDLIGKQIPDALLAASNTQLALKIIETQEATTFTEPTILEQIPAPGMTVRVGSTVHIMVAQPPATEQTPDLITSNQTNLPKPCTITGIHVATSLPVKDGTPLAQYPEPGAPLRDTITVYKSKNDELLIMPDVTGHLVFEVEDLWKKYGLQVEVHAEHVKASKFQLTDTARITEQQPQAGTIFNVNKPPVIHLRV